MAGCAGNNEESKPDSSKMVSDVTVNPNSDKAREQSMPHATFFEPETEWVKIAETEKFQYWQIPEEYAKYAPHNEPLLNGLGELQVVKGQLCFNEGSHMVPVVLSSTYKVSESKIQIDKDEFVQIGEKFAYDNGNGKGNITQIDMYGPEEKFPKEFINSPCFEGKKFTGGSIDIFYDSSSD